MHSKFPCPPLEAHVTHSCNLTCQGCNHYSNYTLPRWLVTPREFETWLATWTARIIPSTFNVLGGEPTLHPELNELLRIAVRYFPVGRFDAMGRDSSVCLITNGAFLHRHSGLKELLIEHRIRLFLSVHYDRRIDIIERVKAWRDDGVPVTIYDYAVHNDWRQFYRGHGATMEPYGDSNPRQSWERCNAKRYFQLYDNKIWKCANIAYLGLAQQALKLGPKWKPYLAYQPLEPSASDKEIAEFFTQEEEFICSMCPSNPIMIKNISDS